MKIDPEILSKLTKILRLAGDKAAHPGEVEAAIAKARAIAVQHNIELSSIDLNDDKKAKEAMHITSDGSLRTRSKHEQPYHRWIYRVLLEVFEVQVIRVYERTPTGLTVNPHLVGSPFDVALAKEIFPFLEEVFPASRGRFVSSGQFTYSRADSNSFYAGFYYGIIDTNKREEEKEVKQSQASASQYALVLRKKEELIEAKLDELYPHRHSTRSRTQNRNAVAEMLGHQEGRKINLRQVGQSAKLGLR